MKCLHAWICAASLLAPQSAPAQDRETKVRSDRERVEAAGFWIYNDLPRGIAEAKSSGKPLLVVFRCIPCEACAQLDEQVALRDASIRALLERFVCVRIVQTNGMDLSLFQFDYDQSWAAFLLNADLTIYGRYGTRSHRTETVDDVSLEGFSKALSAALELHAGFPANRAALAAKRGPESAVKVPEDFPAFRGKFSAKLDYEGKVVQSCIHCHQVGESLRREARAGGKAIPDAVLFPYPDPRTLGLALDPKELASVLSVAKGSPAEKGGFRAGDQLVALCGEPLLSIADVQWVLHGAGETGSLAASVRREGKLVPLSLTLVPGWRRRGDLSWRATSWDLRRMATGGMFLEDLPDAERREAGLGMDVLALRAQHVGEYGEHAVAKHAGFKKGDVVIAVDGKKGRMTETDLFVYMLDEKHPGDRVPFEVRRGSEELELALPVQ